MDPSQHDRAQHWNTHREHDGADNAAGKRGGEAGAKGAAGLALLRHGMAVDHGRRGADMTGDAEQDGGNEVGRGDHRRHAEQKREGGVFIEVVGEGDQHRHADDAIEPRQYADRESDQHADNKNQQARRLKQKLQCMYGAGDHVRLH